MTKKRTFYGNMKRNMAVGLAALTLVTTCMGTGVKAHAAEPGEVGEMPPANIVDNSTGTDVGRAVIKGGIGAIPVVGEFAAEVLDPLVGELFGIMFGEDEDPSVKIIEKLDEIKEQLNRLDVKIDADTQKVLKSLYEHSFDNLNSNITTVRQIEADLYQKIADIEGDKNKTPMQKNAEIGALLETTSTDTAEFSNKLNLIAAYAAGTQADINSPEGLYEMVYKAKCADKESVLGGEAAMKASNYVNNVNVVLENGYKLEAIVLEAKILNAKLLRNMDKEQRDAEYKALLSHFNYDTNVQKVINMCYNYAEAGDPESDSNMRSWKRAAGMPDGKGGYTGAKGMYESLCNAENPNSVTGKYNTMVDKVWFDFIKHTDSDGSRVKVTYLELDDDMKETDYQGLGINQEVEKTEYADYINAFSNTDAAHQNQSDKNSFISGIEAQDVMSHLENLSAYEGENDYEILKNYGFNVEEAVKKDSDRYGISATDVDKVSNEELLKAANPILVKDSKDEFRFATFDHTISMTGKDLTSKEDLNVDVYYRKYVNLEVLSDRTYRRMLAFKEIEDECTVDEATLTADVDIAELAAQIEAGFQNDGDVSFLANTDTENKENADADDTDDSIVLTVDENGQLTGDKMNEAWTVAEDGTIILNKDNKFRFEGTVADRNIQNNGEIVDGNFKNVKLELVDNAKITKGTFEDCEITTNENAVIGEEVQLINTTIIDAKEIENKEEEEQKENQEDVVEDTPVSEQDVF